MGVLQLLGKLIASCSTISSTATLAQDAGVHARIKFNQRPTMLEIVRQVSPSTNAACPVWFPATWGPSNTSMGRSICRWC